MGQSESEPMASISCCELLELNKTAYTAVVQVLKTRKIVAETCVDLF